MHVCFINLKMYIRVDKETTGIHVKKLYIMGEGNDIKKKNQIKWKLLLYDEPGIFILF